MFQTLYSRIIINEMKLFGFSTRDTKEILKITSSKRINRYRQIHYRAYLGSAKPQTLRSSGASRDVRARVRDSVQAVATVDGPAYDPLYGLLGSDDNANLSNPQVERVFRKLVAGIEETLRVDGNQNQTLVPMDDEGLEKLAAKLFKRAIGKKLAEKAVFTDYLRQGLAEFIRLRTADHRDRRSRREQGASFLSTTARQGSLRSSGSLRSVSEPSRRDISLSEPVKVELEGIGFRAELARASLEGIEINIKKESEFSKQEFDEVNLLLDSTDKKLDRALEMLEDKRLALQERYYRLEQMQDAGKLPFKDGWKFGDIEEQLEDLDRKEEILNRGMEANRLARLMMRNLQANSARPRGDQYDNKYVVIKNADGTLAGMAMWGFLGVDVTFEAPGIPWRSDATSLPPEDRITGRMTYVDYLVSFQNVEGVGSFLFQKVLEDSTGKNGKKVFLETTDSSRPFWEKVGFTLRQRGMVVSEYHELVGSVDEMYEATLRSRREMEQTANG